MNDFFKALKSNLGDLVPEGLTLSVANTLDIDYSLRKDNIKEVKEDHIKRCASNIKDFVLNMTTSNTENFTLKNDMDSVLSLFCAAISNKASEDLSKSNQNAKDQNQDKDQTSLTASDITKSEDLSEEKDAVAKIDNQSHAR